MLHQYFCYPYMAVYYKLIVSLSIYKEYIYNLGTEGILSAMFFTKLTCYAWLLFCDLDVGYLYGLQISIVKHFSMGWIKSELENKEKVEISWFFLCLTIFEISQIWSKYPRLEQLYPNVSLFETFARSRLFIWNHHQII